MRPRNKHVSLKRLVLVLVPLPLPESLERAFSEIEQPAPKYADAPEAHAEAPRSAQERL
jgi:hypothetical protein